MKASSGGSSLERRLLLVALVSVVLVSSSCRFVSARAAAPPRAAALVRIEATPTGCAPKPARVAAGIIEFSVHNLDAPTVTEIELRSSNLADVLGEQENLAVGLSASFSATLSPGRFVVDCPGATQSRWSLVTTARAST